MTSLPLFSDPALRERGAIRVRAERSAGDALGTAIRLALSEARPFFSALFAIVGPMVVAAALVRLVGGVVGGGLLGSVVDGAANLLATAAALAFVRLYMRGDPLGVADVWDEARPMLGPLFVYALVLGGLALLLLIPVGVVVSVIGVGSLGVSAVLIGVLAVAAFLVVTPVVSLGLVVVGLDEMRPLAALSRAAELARPHVGRVVLALVLVALLSVFAVGVLGGVVGGLFVAGLSTAGGSVAGAVTSAVATLLVLPVGAVVTLVWVMLYGSLVEIEEGASLGEGLDRLAHVLDDRPAAPAPRDTPEPDDVARPIGRPRAGDHPSDAVARLLGADDAPPTGDPPPAGPPADDPPHGFRGGGFSGDAP